MSREKIISQVKQGIKKRFMKLSEEEKNIIRENKNTAYSMLLKEVLGDELLSGLINTDGKQLLNKGGRVGYAEGNIDPTKEKQIKQMLKMGADESTIASITGATPQQIQFVQQQQKEKKATGGRVGYSTGSIVKGVLLTAKTLSELKPEYLKKLSRLEGYLGSINMEGKGGREAAKKTIEKIDNLKQEYKALEKDLSEKQQLENFDTTDRSKNARGGVAYLMGL